MKKLVLALIALTSVSTWAANSPVIWGPGNKATVIPPVLVVGGISYNGGGSSSPQTTTWTSPTAVTGVFAATTAGQVVLVGTNTKALTEFHIGDTLTMNAETHVISSIGSDTSISFTGDTWGVNAGGTATRAAIPDAYIYPAGGFQVGGSRTTVTNIGTSSNQWITVVASAPAVSSTSVPTAVLKAIGYTGASSTAQPQVQLVKWRGTEASPSPLPSGDTFGQYSLGGGSTTTASYTSASILAKTTEPWSSTAGGSQLLFGVTANTTHVLSTALTLDQDTSATFVGPVNASGTTDSSSPTTGALITAGGLGVAKKGNFGGNVEIAASSAGAEVFLVQNTNSTQGATSQLLAENDASSLLRIMLSASGGIGASSMINGPSAGTVAAQMFTGSSVPMYFGTNSTNALEVDTSQHIILAATTTGTAADTLCLTSGGQIILQAAACTISSRRFKEDIESVDKFSGIDEIMALRPVEFRMKPTIPANPDKVNSTRLQVGLIAEEVEKVDKRLAVYEDDGVTPKSYRQEALIAVLVKAVQQQQHEIEALKRKFKK